MAVAREPVRVVCWNNQPSPYFVRRLNAVSDRGRVGVEAWFSELRASDREWTVDPSQWRFPARLLPPGRRRAGRAVQLLGTQRPDLFATLYADAAFGVTVLAAKLLGIPVVVRALRTFPSWRRRSIDREVAKHCLFRLVDGVQVAGPESAAYVSRYGARRGRVFPIREEIDLPFWNASAETPPDLVRELRARHGLEGCVFLYVGRLWWGKGIETLIEAFRRLQGRSVPCSLVLAGSGEDEHRLRALAAGLPNVVFPGFVEGVELRTWYAISDAFVFPTLGDAYGHVVQEAMACGLPVVSTTAAGDITDRVVDGVTGLLVPPRDTTRFAEAMERIAVDQALAVRLGANGRSRIQAWSTESWAEGFEEMAFELVGRHRRR